MEILPAEGDVIMGSQISILIIIAIVITIFEAFLAIYLIKKQDIQPSKAIYMSLPSVVIIWAVALLVP